MRLMRTKSATWVPTSLSHCSHQLALMARAQLLAGRGAAAALVTPTALAKGNSSTMRTNSSNLTSKAGVSVTAMD